MSLGIEKISHKSVSERPKKKVTVREKLLHVVPELGYDKLLEFAIAATPSVLETFMENMKPEQINFTRLIMSAR